MKFGADREKTGKYQMIFPLNKTTEDLAIAMNRNFGGSSMSGPNYMKSII
jgi:hypothetical protein